MLSDLSLQATKLPQTGYDVAPEKPPPAGQAVDALTAPWGGQTSAHQLPEVAVPVWLQVRASTPCQSY